MGLSADASTLCFPFCHALKSFSSFQTWTDEFLTWNPSEFCGMEKMTVPRSMLWVPDVVIAEE